MIGPVCNTDVHEALKAGPLEAYREHPFVEAIDMCGDGEDVFEVRNCAACMSTMYRPCTLTEAKALNDEHAEQIAARRAEQSKWRQILVDAGCL